MKRVLIIFMALATIGMSAQNKKSDKKENRKEMKAGFTPEQRADLKSKELTLAFDLNTSQQQRVKQLFLKTENNKPERPEKRSEMTDAQKYEAKSVMLDHRIAFKKEMKEILTEDQMTKWERKQGHKGVSLRIKAAKIEKGKNKIIIKF